VTRVVLAPDKFRGSASAAQAATALRDGLRRRSPRLDIIQRPVADGGEGTLGACTAAGYRLVPARASGPDGRPLTACLAVNGETAVIELAAVAGLGLMAPDHLTPLDATTFGVGQLISRALDLGYRKLVLAVGGSATVDGGIGMMLALGARLAVSATARPGGGTRVGRLDLSGLDPRLAGTEFVLAADVTNPLLGPDGAARAFAAQKGATPGEVDILEDRLRQWARAVTEATGADATASPGAGAAGGAGFAATALLGASFRRGIDLIIELTGLQAALAGADLVITGEGSLDAQSLSGKAPVGVAQAARARGVPAIAVAGRVSLSRAQIRAACFTAAYALADLEPDQARSMSHAEELLRRTGARIADEHLAGGRPVRAITAPPYEEPAKPARKEAS
jgi:glycerate 2-kinase